MSSISLPKFLPDLHPFASYLGQRFGCELILGVGDYAADNLVDFHPEFKITGVVASAEVATYRAQYPFGTWLGWDVDGVVSLEKQDLKRALIICTSAANHDRLKDLKQWLDHAPVCLFLSDVFDPSDKPNDPDETADRPRNLADFRLLLEAEGFKVEFTGWTASDVETYPKQTMLAVVTNNQNSVAASRPELSTPSEFHVVAFMAAYNEEDIIVESIRKWTDQGVAVHVLENWSTDNTFELINSLTSQLPVTVERFPATGPSTHFEWGAILKRIEALSNEIKADWFVRRGADEVLTSPWPGLSYRDALFLVDRAGFNCVDHTVVNFCPVDNEFPAGTDHEAYFQHFEFSKATSDFEQIKTWKNYGQSISMMTSGGHDLEFTGRRVYPFKFLLKHYPVRSQTHGERKIFRERKARFNPVEKAQGWHHHYDQVVQDHSFVYSPSALTPFDENDFNQTYLVERLSGIGVIRSRTTRDENLRHSIRQLKRSLAEKEVELGTITNRLGKTEAELERVTSSFGWRLLNRYGRVKHKFLLPTYRSVRRIFRAPSNEERSLNQ